MSIERILALTDLSSPSCNGLALAEDIARRLHAAQSAASAGAPGEVVQLDAGHAGHAGHADHADHADHAMRPQR